MRMRPKRPILRSQRAGHRVLFANGKRYVVAATPSPLEIASIPAPIQHIAPGGCDEYLGSQGHWWICCKSNDGGTISCYQIIHMDPWHSPPPRGGGSSSFKAITLGSAAIRPPIQCPPGSVRVGGHCFPEISPAPAQQSGFRRFFNQLLG